MRNSFDRRVVPEFVLGFVRACQTRVVCHLGGGAALAGAYLGHRMTGDIRGGREGRLPSPYGSRN